MDERIIEVKDEVLETVLSDELKGYLEEDEKVNNKLNEKIDNLLNQIELVKKEKEESEKNFEDRLNEFREKLTKEKEEMFNEFSKREQDILNEKEKIEGIKTLEEAKKESYISSLNGISNEFDSKISSIEDAIKTCGDNETLSKALEEEKNKKLEKLNSAYDNRKNELQEVLSSIGEKEEEKVDINSSIIREPVTSSIDINNDINPLNSVTQNDEKDDEIISHESREDVVNDIFGSEEIMEGHVFPFLKSVM